MHREVGWMTRADTYLLEFMGKCDNGNAILTPRTISKNINYDRVYIGRRCRKLAEKGLIENVEDGDGFYRLTPKGKKFVRGLLHPSDLVDNELEDDEE